MWILTIRRTGVRRNIGKSILMRPTAPFVSNKLFGGHLCVGHSCGDTMNEVPTNAPIYMKRNPNELIPAVFHFLYDLLVLNVPTILIVQKPLMNDDSLRECL